MTGRAFQGRSFFVASFLVLFFFSGLSFIFRFTLPGRVEDHKISMYFLGSILKTQEFSFGEDAGRASQAPVMMPLSGIRLASERSAQSVSFSSRPDPALGIGRGEKTAPSKFLTERVKIVESAERTGMDLGIPEAPDMKLKISRP